MGGDFDKVTQAFIALGANMPFEGVQGADLLAGAVEALEQAGLRLVALSSVWRTEAWPQGNDQPDYFNAVAVFEVLQRGPRELYDLLAGIERRFGRERRERWAPRTLDLDIIALEGFEGRFGGINLPHPRMQERAFVLAPLAEIAPDWRHPESGLTAAELLAGLPVGYRYDCVGAIRPL